MKKHVQLPACWLARLSDEFEKPYMSELKQFLLAEKQKGKEIFPPGAKIFAALNHTLFDDVKVVILGQDPYHGRGQAQGLCFSVGPGVPAPPSLVNIYKEMETDLGDIGFKRPSHGNLLSWTRQGVLLLNSVLTVEANRAASHKNRGWETFTDRIVHLIDEEKDNVAFILWGAYAQKKGAFIDRDKHLVLSSPHPSPLSASRGFFGTRPFSRVNQWLEGLGLKTIDWRLPEEPSAKAKPLSPT